MLPVIRFSAGGVADGKIRVDHSLSQSEGAFVPEGDLVSIQNHVDDRLRFGPDQVAGGTFMDPLLRKQGILVIGGRCPLGQLRGQRGKIGSEKRLVSGILQISLYSLFSGLAFPGKIRVKKGTSGLEGS